MTDEHVPGELDELAGRLDELQNKLDNIDERIAQNLIISNTLLENTDRSVTRLLRFLAVMLTVLVLFISGAFGFAIANLLTLQDKVIDQVSVQVPPEVAAAIHSAVPPGVEIAVMTAIPDAARAAAETQVGIAFQRLPPTVDARVEEMVAVAIQTHVKPIVITAVAESQLGVFFILVASDKTFEGVAPGAEELRRDGYAAQVYKIGEFFAVAIGPFGSVVELQPELLKVKSSVIPGAYFIDFETACPFSEFVNPGFYQCSSDPID